jgi:hypothetical protein
MTPFMTESTTRRAATGTTLVVALLVMLVASVPVRAQTDLTDPSLPHAADTVLLDLYDWYDPSHVSNDRLGLEYAAWHSGDERTGELFPHWVQIDFGSPQAVAQLNILAYSESPSANLRLKDFRFEGSQDGVTFTPLHAGLLRYANQHVWQSFFFENSTAYRHYRLYGLNNWGCYDFCEQMIIEEWEMFSSAVGACCFPSGACLAGTQAACEAAGGEFQGSGTDCQPNLCELIAVEPASWSMIKALYR